jgi:2-dehydropantoate 2-reductase
MNGVTIVGAGGIGCAVGYALRIAGIDVTFVESDLDKVVWGKTQGILVDRNPTRQAEFELFNEWLPDANATVLLCTKCYDNASVLERVPDTVILIPIQNGFDQALENSRVALEGIASFVSECLPHQSHTRITRAGKLHLGGRGSGRSLDEALKGKLAFLGEALAQAGLFQVELVPDILPYKHTKLMYNAAISPLAAAAGLHNGQLLSVPAARRWFFDLLRENYTILCEAGVRLGKVGPFHPHTVSRILSSRMVSRMLSWAFYPSLRGTYCSMYADLPAGRTEIDYYNRYLIDLAGDRPCPANRRIYELVKKMERERIAPGLHVLKELDGA